MHKLEDLVHQSTAKNTGGRYLLAVSGGLDSMVLLSIFHTLKLPFEVAHVNFQLRGLESENDQKLVETFCSKNSIRIHVCRTDLKEILNDNKGNLQQHARRIRYDFFQKFIDDKTVDYVVTAHHQDDQVETFWLMLSRSAGISGLSGMDEVSNCIFRPLLTVSKMELKDYAIEHGIEWREDQSNQKNDYQRNLWRNELLPYLTKEIPSLNTAVLTLMACFKEDKAVQDKTVSSYIKQIQSTCFINFNNYDQLSIYQLITIFNYFNIPVLKIAELSKIRQAQKGKIVTIDSNKRPFSSIVKEFDSFYFAKKENSLSLPTLLIERVDFIPASFTKQEVFLDAQKIEGELRLRPWIKGDRINLIGLKGSKLVSDVLTDAKIPNFSRDKQWVLVDDKHIIACWGHAIGRDCLADTKTIEIISVRTA
jgi:tRNA(Ile)-lysidine synthase